ncbi:MAG: TIGR02450 family Trp-rich protein [Moraxellaceae bacterium]
MASNRFNPRKLLESKWTAVRPVAGERHFVVVRVPPADAPPEQQARVEIEAVLTRRREWIAHAALRDASCWQMGWK